jgi:hypothetical protein
MSKPWYYTIGYPVKVLLDGTWEDGIIRNDYRSDDGIISIMTEEGKKVWFVEKDIKGYVIPNFPDDNPWVTDQLPKDSEYAKVYMTIEYPAGIATVKGAWDHGYFYCANGRLMRYPVLAWKYYRLPEPYKEES